SWRCIAATVVGVLLRKPRFLLHPPDPCAIVFVETKDSARMRPGKVCGATREFAGFAKELVQNQSQRGETMTRRLVTGALVGALAAVFSAGVAAQMKADPKSYVPGVAGCNTTNCGYWLDSDGNPANNVIKSGAYNGGAGLSGNLCWRTGYWAPSMAIEACDPD